jgi:hypothetical protein
MKNAFRVFFVGLFFGFYWARTRGSREQGAERKCGFIRHFLRRRSEARLFVRKAAAQ